MVPRATLGLALAALLPILALFASAVRAQDDAFQAIAYVLEKDASTREHLRSGLCDEARRLGKETGETWLLPRVVAILDLPPDGRKAWLGAVRTLGIRRDDVPGDLDTLVAAACALAPHREPWLESRVWGEAGLAALRATKLEIARAAFARAAALARPLPARDVLADAVSNEGVCLEKLGRLDDALVRHREALALSLALADPNGVRISEGNLALVHLRRGELDAAIHRAEAAIDAARELDDPAALAEALSDLGAILGSAGLHERALRPLEEAARLAERSGDRRRDSATLTNLGVILGRLGRGDEAVRCYERSIVEAQAAKDKALEAYALANLAESRRIAGELESAMDRLVRASTLFQEADDPVGDSRARLGFAQISHDRSRFDLASDVLAEVLKIARATGDAGTEIEALVLQGRCREASGLQRSALESYQGASLRAERLRGAGTSTEVRLAGGARLREPHVRAALVRADRGEPARALEHLESAHARMLLDLVGDVRRVGDPALSVLEARAAALDHERRAALASPALAADDRRSRVRALREERDRVLDDLVAAEARLERLAGGVAGGRPLDVSELRALGLLDGGTVLLEYAFAEDEGLLVAASAEKVEAHGLPGAAEVEAVVDAARRAIATPGPLGEAERTALAKAAALLVEPARAAIGEAKALLVVPDGPLAALPFEALLVDGAPLVRRHEIAYAPSASVAVRLRERATAAKAGEPAVVAVGASAVPGWPELPGAAREATAVGALFPEARRRVVSGGDARERAVRAALEAEPRPTHLHLAAHGRLDLDRPMLSGIALVPDPGEAPLPEDDGLLTLREARRLDLAGVRLATLSACETAIGKPVAGEGSLALPWALLAAGADACCVTLWRVDDEATGPLMTAFYRAMLKDGLAPAAALRRAKLEMLDSGDVRLAHPSAWAAPVIVGAPSR